MKPIFLILFALIFQFLFIGCDNSTEPIIKNGKISGVVTIGNYNRQPHSTLWIKIHKENNNSSQFIDSVFTENGRYTFNNRSDGLYSVCFKQDRNYTPFRDWQTGEITCRQFEVKSSSKTDSLDFQLFAWHLFSRDTIVFNVDTTNWMGASVSSIFYNEGVRDTIIWNFQLNSIPSWLIVSPLNGIYEPEIFSNKLLDLSISKYNFPITMWNKSVSLVIENQFAVHILTILFKVV
ncbi:MAG: hypothetical protein WAR59_14500 [Ignavibacteriaceae bacterium]